MGQQFGLYIMRNRENDDPYLGSAPDNVDLDLGMRAHVFVDHWNFALAQRSVGISKHGRMWRVNWTRLPEWLVREAEKALGSGYLDYAGTTVFTSFNPANPRSVQHRNWATGWLGRQPRVEVIIHQQQRAQPPRCPACNRQVEECPYCGAEMAGYQEKKVDTDLAVRLVEAANRRTVDVAILVTSDSDLIPAVDAARRAGCLVVQAGFPPGGRRLRKRCNAGIDIDAGREEISR